MNKELPDDDLLIGQVVVDMPKDIERSPELAAMRSLTDTAERIYKDELLKGDNSRIRSNHNLENGGHVWDLVAPRQAENKKNKQGLIIGRDRLMLTIEGNGKRWYSLSTHWEDNIDLGSVSYSWGQDDSSVHIRGSEHKKHESLMTMDKPEDINHLTVLIASEFARAEEIPKVTPKNSIVSSAIKFFSKKS